MPETVFRTDDVDRENRFEYWYRMMRNSILPAIVRTDDVAGFRAGIRVVDLGRVRAHELVTPRVQVNRPLKLVQQSDPEHCHLTTVVRGSLGFAQAGRSATLGVGDILFYDSSHPCTGWGNRDQEVPGIHVGLQFPRAMFPHPNIIDRFIGTVLPNRGGIRGLLAVHMRELAKLSIDGHGPAAALGSLTVDLVATLLAHEVDVPDSLPPESGQRVLLARIRHFIHQHLSDPSLCPATIAAAHHISTRYLHKLFQTQEATVAGWIRQRRLERCRVDLADARQQSPSHPRHRHPLGFHRQRPLQPSLPSHLRHLGQRLPPIGEHGEGMRPRG